MGTLLESCDDRVLFHGKRFKVDTAYDTVLLVQRLYGEDSLEAGDKVEGALRLMTRNSWKLWRLTLMEKVKLLEKITEEKIQLPKRPQIGPPKRLMDFELDGDYIYASFRQAYGMDLYKERGKLQWRKFCQLLEELPEKTKMREVMRIRAMEVPEPTRYNQKERQNILQLKSYYALPVKGRGGQRGLDMLFSALERMAG